MLESRSGGGGDFPPGVRQSDLPPTLARSVHRGPVAHTLLLPSDHSSQQRSAPLSRLALSPLTFAVHHKEAASLEVIRPWLSWPPFRDLPYQACMPDAR